MTGHVLRLSLTAPWFGIISLSNLHVFTFLEIKCPTSIPNGWLPHYCKAIVDESCDDYTCNRGYQRNVAVVSLTCTESANWNHNVSSLCLGMYVTLYNDLQV